MSEKMFQLSRAFLSRITKIEAFQSVSRWIQVNGALAGVVCFFAGFVFKFAIDHFPESKTVQAHPSPEIQRKTVLISQEILNQFPISTVYLKESDSVEEVLLPGKVQHDPSLVAVVNARTTGRVIKVHVTESDSVKKGQVLATLQSTEVAQAEAEYLKSLSRFRLMSQQEQRSSELLEKQIISAKEYGLAKMDFESAKADLGARKIHLKALGLHSTEISRLEEVQDHSGELLIRSPLEGIVLEKKLKLGELVQPNDNIFVVGDLEKVRIELDVYENEVQFVKEGMSAQLLIPGNSNAESSVQAKVSRVSNQIDPGSRSAKVWLELDNRKLGLKFGQAVTGKIQGIKTDNSPRKVMTLPAEAVHKIEGQNFVFLRLGEQSFEPREIRVGRMTDQWVEVLGGLPANSPVASHGSYVIKSEYLRQ